MGVPLDPWRQLAVHHHLVQLVAPRSDVVHEDLIGCEFILDRSLGVVGLLQLDTLPELVHSLNP